MADNYRKDPEAISRLTPEQYKVTQKNGTEPAFRKPWRVPVILQQCYWGKISGAAAYHVNPRLSRM